jgi:DNA-binding ferritin-like protein (Dps family)
MNFWEKLTGSDLTRDWQAFEARAAALPDDYRQAWEQIKTHLLPHGDFTGRNLTPIVDGVLGLLETTAADGESAEEALGDDIPAFCAALAGGHGAKDYRARWRDQLNRNVARKLSRLGG